MREGEIMRNGLNQFEREVLEDTGLSIPRFAHIRNRVYCSDCKQWFRASKYLWKDKIQEDKDADAWGAYIHPGIMCGRCGAKCREEAYGSRDVIHPSFGHYYLYDELRKRTHVSIFGESEFATWERARFVRSCSTLWPFLRIRRCWNGIGFKEQAQSKVMERRKIENVCFEGGRIKL